MNQMSIKLKIERLNVRLHFALFTGNAREAQKIRRLIRENEMLLEESEGTSTMKAAA